MRPQKLETPNGDLFRSALEAIIDPGHELLRLAELIDWAGSMTPLDRSITKPKDGEVCPLV